MDLHAPSLVAGLNISVTNTATLLLSLLNTAAAASFVANADPWQNLDGVDITPEDGNVRISFHPGLTPTAAAGRLLTQGVTYYFRFKDLDNVRLISTTASAVKCSLSVGKCRQGEFDVAAGGGSSSGSSSSSSSASAGGGESSYSNVLGDFTATANSGAKTITLSAYAAGSPLSGAITALNFANGSIKRISSTGVVDTLPMTNIAFAANVLTLADMTANFAVGDTVEVNIIGPDKSYTEASDWKKVNEQQMPKFEDNTLFVAATQNKPLASPTYTWSVAKSSALQASNVIKGSAGTIRSIAGRIDSTAPTGTYYLQLFNNSSLPADGAGTLLTAPMKIQVTNGVDANFSMDFTMNGVHGATGLVLVLSTTEFTKTIAGAYLSINALYI